MPAMKTQALRSNPSRNPFKCRKAQARAAVRIAGAMARVVVGTMPRAWSVEAANDPQA
jgi:hypothetical protein